MSNSTASTATATTPRELIPLFREGDAFRVGCVI
jgi:hypothetical protein